MKITKYIPLALFSLFALKVLVLGTTSFAELGVISVLAAYAAYHEYANKKEFEAKLEAINKRFEAVDSHISQLYTNDKETLKQVQTLKVPGALKNFGIMK